MCDWFVFAWPKLCKLNHPLVTNPVVSRLTREWTKRSYNFPLADWSQIMIYLSRKDLFPVISPLAWRLTRLPAIRELKQPRRRRQQKPHKFAYLTIKNSIFARFARAFFIFWHFEDVLVLSTTWNDLFCRCVDDMSIWWQMLIFVFLCPKRWFQFNSRVVRTQFSNIMTLNNWKMIAETRSCIFRWRSRFRRRRGCLSSLLSFETMRAWTSKINVLIWQITRLVDSTVKNKPTAYRVLNSFLQNRVQEDYHQREHQPSGTK